MRTKILLFALIQVLWTAPALGQAGRRVAFKFDWKPGISAEMMSVTAMSGMSPAQAADTTNTIVRSSLRMTVESHPQGRLVRTAPVSTNGAPPTVAFGTAALQVAASTPTAMVVTTDGKFVSVADTVALRKMLDSSLAAMQTTLGSLPTRARAPLEAMMTVAGMNDVMRRGWEQQTAFYLTRSWTIDEEVSMPIEVPFPMGPGRTLKANQRITVLAVAPCDSAAPAVRCALVRRVVELDHAAMRAAMLDMLGGEGQMVGLPESSTDITSDMLVEVQTLLPRRTNQRVIQNTRMGDTARRTEVTTIVTYNYTTR